MANIELLAEITASGMYIFDYFTSPTQTVCLRIVYAETKKMIKNLHGSRKSRTFASAIIKIVIFTK